ncbi:hypothetical protein KKD72_02275 [Patescibacteria group bacterium]|nr:hypothetical protein [Patescibacteria group bacterium]
MLKKTKKGNKNKQVTVGDLDKALFSQSKTILGEVDLKIVSQTKSFDKKLESQTESFDKKLESQTKTFDVKIDRAMESQSKTILKAVDFKFNKLDGEIKEIKRDVKKSDNKIDRVLNQQDKILKKLTDLSDESVASIDLYKKHDKKIENHDERILALEIKS